MIQQIIFILIMFNFIILIGLVIVLKRWQKQGKLTDKRLALTLTGYFSFSTIITSLPILPINSQVTLLIDLVFLLVFWCIGFPWIRWLYKHFSSTK